VPEVYSTFELNKNSYLVTEYFSGENLLSFLRRQRRRLSFARILRLSTQLAKFIAEMHSAGWAWGDCKPSNLIVGNRDQLRAFDFESARGITDSRKTTWKTSGFTPSHFDSNERSAVGDDLYAWEL
jgi:serine/threonine-protein kinase